MAQGPEINKFETVNLAEFYKSHGSDFSQNITVFGPPIDKPHIEPFPTPASPPKIGITVAGFLFSPAFTTPALKVHNSIPNIDAFGFTPGLTYGSPSQFVGITVTTKGVMQFNSQRLSSQLKVHNGLSDIDMTGFTTGRQHLQASEFTGITGTVPNLEFNMSTDNPGTTYAWTRMLYNDKVTGGGNYIEDIKAKGFTTGKLHKGLSDFIGIGSYDYPVGPAPFGSYDFNTQNYISIFNNVIPNAARTNDGIVQQYPVFGGSGPYGDSNIMARKSQFNTGWDSQISRLYTSIPGKGDTDLRKESSNFHSFGSATDQPFIIRDIGSNWSLFSDGPGPKFGIDLIRGGVGTAINRSLHDALRIGKFLISPKGLLFIVKNIGMQLTNPKVQTDNIIGIGANRVYPLGLSTLAQTLTTAIGIHFVRHGLGPLNSTLPGKGRYENNIFQAETAGGLLSGAAGKAATKDLKVDTGGLDSKIPPSAPPDETPMGDGSPRSNSRLVFLATDLKSGLWATSGPETEDPDPFTGAIPNMSSIPGMNRGMSKKKITRLSDKGFLGPHSVYGIGGTSIFRSVVGISVSAHEQTGGTYADSKYFTGLQGDGENPSFPRVYDTPADENKYSDKYGPNTYDDMETEKSANESQLAIRRSTTEDPSDGSTATNTSGFTPWNEELGDSLYISQNQKLRRYQTLAYGQLPDRTGKLQSLMDFRELLGNENKNFQRPNDGDAEGPAWDGQDFATRFGADYGRQIAVSGEGNTDRSDRKKDLGLDDKVVNNEGRDFGPDQSNEAAEYTTEEFEDLIAFKFTTLDDESLQFRAYLSNLTDTVAPTWQDITYVGRTTPTYLFQSIERTVSIDFKVYSMTRAELEANYKRLNRFIQLISPEFRSGLPVGPLLKLTMGDYFVDNPIIVDNFGITIPDDSPWDIDKGRQLPFYLDCTLSAKILFNKGTVGEEVGDVIHSRDSDWFGAVAHNTWRVGA